MLRLGTILLTLFCLPAVSSAHFLWLKLDPQQSDKVHVYFSESATPDDPALLKKVAGAEAWVIPGRGTPQPLTLRTGDDSLIADLKAEQQGSPVILKQNYGVRTRGTDSFQLQYYAKTYTLGLPGTWKAISDPERLPLEITPSLQGRSVALKVTWQGKPLPGATISIIEPGKSDHRDVTANDQGIAVAELSAAGDYALRVRHQEATAGEQAGEKYTAIRHYSTLTFPFRALNVTSDDKTYAALPQGLTSFGAAISNGNVYVYGGNYGSAHDYANEEQSGDLWTLNLSQPNSWKKSASGPKLQGLALVEHQGRLYRVGGFTALNARGEEENLQSQPEFARLSADGSSWESLPPLPAGRSSHDAAVVGDTMYVVGGWKMSGKGGSTAVWHDTALACHLGEEQLAWKTIATPPFKRRALAVAEYQGKLVCLGGMNEKGGPTRDVMLYDPKSDAWTAGPALPGTGMEGFGCSAFACHEQFFASTMSGALLRLNAKGDRWELAGQLSHPRFFHRLLATPDRSLIVIGGANMDSGKVLQTERLTLDRKQD